jgi:hypothetical protein
MILAHVKHINEKLPGLCKEKKKGDEKVMTPSKINSIDELRRMLTSLKEEQTELKPMNFIDNKIQFLKDYKHSETLSLLESKID